MMAQVIVRHIMAASIPWTQVGVTFLLGVLTVVAVNLPYWIKRKPKATCHATIKEKRIGESKTPHIYYRGSRFNYVILFVDDEGHEIEVCVSEGLYVLYKEGVSGRLTYQGESLLEFVEDSVL